MFKREFEPDFKLLSWNQLFCEFAATKSLKSSKNGEKNVGKPNEKTTKA